CKVVVACVGDGVSRVIVGFGYFGGYAVHDLVHHLDLGLGLGGVAVILVLVGLDLFGQVVDADGLIIGGTHVGAVHRENFKRVKGDLPAHRVHDLGGIAALAVLLDLGQNILVSRLQHRAAAVLDFDDIFGDLHLIGQGGRAGAQQTADDHAGQRKNQQHWQQQCHPNHRAGLFVVFLDSLAPRARRPARLGGLHDFGDLAGGTGGVGQLVK